MATLLKQRNIGVAAASYWLMEQISGDEVTAQAIDQRRLRIENEFSKGLISNETYQLERNFLDFLKAFYDLKHGRTTSLPMPFKLR